MADSEQIDLAKAEGFQLGLLRVDPPTLQVTGSGKRETLEPRIMQVFVALARRRGEVVSRDDLITQCWDGRSVGDDAINRCIGRLRRLAETEGGFAIETVPRVGYRLLETEPVATPPAAAATPLPPAETAHRAWWKNWRLLAGIAIIAVAVCAAGFRLMSPSPLNRVAVLPLQPLGDSDDARVFGTAVAEQIVGVLNENQIQAVARSEVQALRGPGRDDAAEKLGADFILDGTVQHTPDGLKIIVHLDRASSHSTLWTATIEQAKSDPVSLQSQVAARVVDVIKAAMQAASLKDDAAVAAYLKAKEYGRESGHTAGILRRDQMRIVVTHAPDFSLGHSGLAWASAFLIQFSEPGETADLRRVAREEAGRALALDADNGEAYLALMALAPPRDYGEQERLFRKGLSVQPDEPTLNSSLAALLEDVGRIDEAVPLYERAAMLDPLSPRKNAGLANVKLISGDKGEARAAIARDAKLWPNNISVWGAHLTIEAYSDPAKARTLLADGRRIAPQLEPEFFSALDAALVALAHNTPQTRAAARTALLAAVADDHLDAFTTIDFLTRIGDSDDAFRLAEKAYFPDGPAAHNGRPNAAVLLRPSTAPLRRDPRFLPLVEKLGLVAYWKTHTAPDFCRSETVAPCPDMKKTR